MIKRVQQLKSPLANLFKSKTYTSLLIAGVLLLGVLDFLLVRTFERDQAFRLTLMAQKLQAQISSSITEHIAALLSINVVYQNFVDITNEDFEQYGKSISAHLPGFDRLLFIDPNYKVTQIYPSSPQNKGLYNQSIKPNQYLLENLQRAKQDKKERTTGLIPFFGKNKALLAILPVYRSSKEFLGFAVGEISLDEIWRPFKNKELLPHYQLQLVDPYKVSYFEGNTLSSRTKRSDSAHQAISPFYLTGNRWKLMLQYSNPFDILFFERLALWTSGLLLLTLILMLMMRSRTHKTALGEAQKQFETIFKSSPDGIAMLDNKLQFQLTNPTLHTWVDHDGEDLSDKNFFDVFRCQCPHLAKCQELSFMLCTSEQFEQELPERLEVDILKRKEHSPVRLRFNASRIKRKQAANGNTEEGFICLLGDISASKDLERHKETYVATLTHDLKTPLLAQEMVLDSMLSGSTGPITTAQKKLMQASKQSIHDLLEMVNDSLLFYQLESSDLSMNKQPNNLSKLLEEMLEPLQPLAATRLLQFELHASTELPQAWVDSIQIKRVFRNILSNAISYAKRDSLIRIKIEAQPNDKILVEVSNEGKGILPDELPRIFEKHYSLSRKFKQIGTGLGLYISRRIVELHGGRIWATSEPNQATSFFVELPLPKSRPLATAS